MNEYVIITMCIAWMLAMTVNLVLQAREISRLRGKILRLDKSKIMYDLMERHNK